MRISEVVPLNKGERQSIKDYLTKQVETLWSEQSISLVAISTRMYASIESLLRQLETRSLDVRRLEGNLRMIKGLNYTCPNCGTKTVEVVIGNDMKGKCAICLMEFSLPLLDDLRRSGKLDLGITARMESLSEKNRSLTERLTRLQQHIHRLGVFVPPEVMFGDPRQSEESGNG